MTSPTTTATPLTDSQRSVLSAIWLHLVIHGRWPTFEQVDRQLYRTLDAEIGDVLPTVPAGLLHGVTPGSHISIEGTRELGLTCAGIEALGAGAAELSYFVQLVLLAVDIERGFEAANPSDRPRLTAEHAATVLKLDPDQRGDVLSRLAAILFVEQWGWSSASDIREPNWSFDIDSDVRKYRRITSLQEYWALRPKPWLDANVIWQPADATSSGNSERADQFSLNDLIQVVLGFAGIVGGATVGWAGMRVASFMVCGLAGVAIVHHRRKGGRWKSLRAIALVTVVTLSLVLMVVAFLRP